MVIDAHGHVTAPDKLYVYKAGLLSHRGAHGRGSSAQPKPTSSRL
jgi:OH-DDVA meta-cleavage compound hydrolase